MQNREMTAAGKNFLLRPANKYGGGGGVPENVVDKKTHDPLGTQRLSSETPNSELKW